ncbi:MAG: hypothetical protein ACXVFU_13825, partial [Nocardioidaceae bacterium]
APMLRDCLAPDPKDRPGTAHLLDALGAPRAVAPVDAGPATQPYAVAAGRRGADSEGDATEVVGDDAPTLAGPVVPPTPAVAPTLALATAGPPPDVLTPAREPYVAPPPPQWPPEQTSMRPGAGLERTLLTFAAGALVVLGFARAPYITLAASGAAVLLLRTLSWTTEAARERQHARGRRRWYDGALTLLSTPWYLLVACTGTFVLLGFAATLTLVTGLAYLLFRPPLGPGLLLMGGVLALALWWGPGGRRVRRPVRRGAAVLSRRGWAVWTAIGALALGAAACAWFLSSSGVSWAPWPGPPWRAGTVLGDVVRWL